MNHPKMRYTYVGCDSHKDTHTAVFLDCFFEKLGEITFPNLPSEFGMFLSKAEEYKLDGTEFLFGLEDVSAYGRTLAVFLMNHHQQVKHVNALLVARERKNQNVVEKTDSIDAQCAARVLLSKFHELPNADIQDKYYILRTLVIRRDFIVKNNTCLKNHLHSLLTPHYPNYRAFFPNIETQSSLAFFMKYPSPSTLNHTTHEELTDFFKEKSQGKVGAEKAREIIDHLEDTTVQFQEIRDMAVQSTVRQIEFNLQEIERIETTMSIFLDKFDCTLLTMAGINVVTAAQLLSCIGDIKKFSTPAKLARYSGVAPITQSSGKKELQFANQRGNRELHSIIYKLAVRISMTVGCTNKAINPFFYEYYHRKMSEGKTKRQAIKCVERRLVTILWSMLTHGEEYINPPMYDVPKNKKKSEK